jgi:phage shock protein C
MSAQENHVALPFRSHNILGVCEGIGEDFGFNPLFLRVPFAASVLLSPTYAVAAYLALGAVVLLSRLLFPNVRQQAEAQAQTAQSQQANDSEMKEPQLPLAA